MTDHKHGEMDISEHEQTFEGFTRAAGVVIACALFILLFLALFNS